MLQDLFHLLLLFRLHTVCLCSHIPSLNIIETISQLNIIDRGRDLRQLLKDRHDHKLDKACLPASDLRSVTIAQHGHFETLRLFHITLVKEFLEEQVSPLGAHLEFP